MKRWFRMSSELRLEVGGELISRQIVTSPPDDFDDDGFE